jgi:hypothetical protein
MGLASLSLSAPPVQLAGLTLKVEVVLLILKRTFNNLNEPLERPLILWESIIRNQRDLKQLWVPHDLRMDEIPHVVVIERNTQPMPDGLEIVPPLMGTTITIVLIMVIGEIRECHDLDQAVISSQVVIDHVQHSASSNSLLRLRKSPHSSTDIVVERRILPARLYEWRS